MKYADLCVAGPVLSRLEEDLEIFLTKEGLQIYQSASTLVKKRYDAAQRKLFVHLEHAIAEVIEKLRKDFKEKIRRATAGKSEEITAELVQTRKLVNGLLEQLHYDLIAAAVFPHDSEAFTTDETAEVFEYRDSDDSNDDTSDEEEDRIKSEVLDDADELGF